MRTDRENTKSGLFAQIPPPSHPNRPYTEEQVNRLIQEYLEYAYPEYAPHPIARILPPKETTRYKVCHSPKTPFLRQYTNLSNHKTQTITHTADSPQAYRALNPITPPALTLPNNYPTAPKPTDQPIKFTQNPEEYARKIAHIEPIVSRIISHWYTDHNNTKLSN